MNATAVLDRQPAALEQPTPETVLRQTLNRLNIHPFSSKSVCLYRQKIEVGPPAESWQVVEQSRCGLRDLPTSARFLAWDILDTRRGAQFRIHQLEQAGQILGSLLQVYLESESYFIAAWDQDGCCNCSPPPIRPSRL